MGIINQTYSCENNQRLAVVSYLKISGCIYTGTTTSIHLNFVFSLKLEVEISVQIEFDFEGNLFWTYLPSSVFNQLAKIVINPKLKRGKRV